MAYEAILLLLQLAVMMVLYGMVKKAIMDRYRIKMMLLSNEIDEKYGNSYKPQTKALNNLINCSVKTNDTVSFLGVMIAWFLNRKEIKKLDIDFGSECTIAINKCNDSEKRIVFLKYEEKIKWRSMKYLFYSHPLSSMLFLVMIILYLIPKMIFKKDKVTKTKIKNEISREAELIYCTS